jgi:hypothetical protein
VRCSHAARRWARSEPIKVDVLESHRETIGRNARLDDRGHDLGRRSLRALDSSLAIVTRSRERLGRTYWLALRSGRTTWI